MSRATVRPCYNYTCRVASVTFEIQFGLDTETGDAMEVFVHSTHIGSDFLAQVQQNCKDTSKLLQAGANIDELIESTRGVGTFNPCGRAYLLGPEGETPIGVVDSVPHLIREMIRWINNGQNTPLTIGD